MLCSVAKKLKIKLNFKKRMRLISGKWGFILEVKLGTKNEIIIIVHLGRKKERKKKESKEERKEERKKKDTKQWRAANPVSVMIPAQPGKSHPLTLSLPTATSFNQEKQLPSLEKWYGQKHPRVSILKLK